MAIQRRRRELEDLWRSRLVQAQTRYEDATAKCRVLSDEWRQGLRPNPDGAEAVALTQAYQEEAAAMREYARVLRIFTDLVVYRKTPQEE